MEPPWAAVQVGLLPCSPRPASPALLSSFSLSLWAYTFYKLLFFFIVSVLFQEEGPLNACVKPATSNQKPVQNSLIGSSLIPDVCPDTLPPFPKKTAALHPRGLGLWLVHVSIPSTLHGAEQAAGTQGTWSVACTASRMRDWRGQEQATAWGQGLGQKGKQGLALPLATGAVGAKGQGASLPPSLSVASRGPDGACASRHADFRTGKATGSLCSPTLALAWGIQGMVDRISQKWVAFGFYPLLPGGAWAS